MASHLLVIPPEEISGATPVVGRFTNHLLSWGGTMEKTKKFPRHKTRMFKKSGLHQTNSRRLARSSEQILFVFFLFCRFTVFFFLFAPVSLKRIRSIGPWLLRMAVGGIGVTAARLGALSAFSASCGSRLPLFFCPYAFLRSVNSAGWSLAH